MNPEVKRIWLDALRSKKYTQGQGHLCSDDKYCCLGVLAEEAHQRGIVTRVSDLVLNGDGSLNIVYYGEDEATLSLPEEVIEWAGLNDPDPLVALDSSKNFMWSGIRKHLSFLNDNFLFDFEQIADYIEQL